jgi:phosphatidylinositol alpha-1,6-mannosyltransferase
MSRLPMLTGLFLPTKGGTAIWAAEVYKRLGGKEIHPMSEPMARIFVEAS